MSETPKMRRRRQALYEMIRKARARSFALNLRAGSHD